jgi:hypothetical protein
LTRSTPSLGGAQGGFNNFIPFGDFLGHFKGRRESPLDRKEEVLRRRSQEEEPCKRQIDNWNGKGA